jgi:hypothetical protein
LRRNGLSALAGFVAAVSVACLAPAGRADADVAPTSAMLVGQWLGAALGETPACGTSIGRFGFDANGVYTYGTTSEICAAFSVSGAYEVRGNVLHTMIQQCTSPLCYVGQQFDEPISAPDPDTFVLEGRYLYHRQS